MANQATTDSSGNHTLQCTCDDCMSQSRSVNEMFGKLPKFPCPGCGNDVVAVGVVSNPEKYGTVAKIPCSFRASGDVCCSHINEGPWPGGVLASQTAKPCDCACCAPCRASTTYEARLDFERARAKAIMLLTDCTPESDIIDLHENLKQRLNEMSLAAPFLKEKR